MSASNLEPRNATANPTNHYTEIVKNTLKRLVDFDVMAVCGLGMGSERPLGLDKWKSAALFGTSGSGQQRSWDYACLQMQYGG